MLWLYQRMMFGEITHSENRKLTDLSGREIALMVPILILIFWIGIYPNTFLRKTDAASKHLLEQMRVNRELPVQMASPPASRLTGQLADTIGDRLR